MNDKETNQVILILLMFAFALGFILAQAIYDNTPMSYEDYIDLQRTEIY